MTDAYTFDGSRTAFGSTAAVVVATVAATVLGVSAGYALQTLLGVVGGIAFGYAARDVSQEELRARIRGSSLLMVASVFVVAALALEKANAVDAVLVGAITATMGVTTLAALMDPDEAVKPVFAALARSFVATIAGTILAAALYANVFSTVVFGSWTLFTVMLATTPMAGFVALQFEFVLLGLFAGRAGRAAATLEPSGNPEDVDVVDVRDVPRALWVLLGVEVVLLTFPGGAGPFEYLLAVAGPAGTIAGALLSSVYLHGAILVVLAVLVVLPVVAAVRRSAVAVFGNRAPKTLAFATGGVALSVIVILVSSIPGFDGFVKWLAGSESAVTAAVDLYGFGPGVLGGVSGVLVVMGIGLFFYIAAFGLPFVPEHASGFVFGAATLFVAAVAGAFAGAPAPAVFVAMAAAIAVWDVGEYAVEFGEEVGQAASTRSVEAVHVIATVGVGLGAVLLASLATHFFVPLMTAVPQDRAMTALALLAVALVAFAYLADTGSEDATEEGSESGADLTD
ncbi:hypothetical protein [Halorubellus sp. PRR65]|uniref:DUF7519 family protein n=1 Tax=Halorubellus sp. PRR65 TaxID=3098148 RepID=UPI002B263A43|nr:hypothetical protein [Halorubellus sp. PRR65]